MVEADVNNTGNIVSMLEVLPPRSPRQVAVEASLLGVMGETRPAKDSLNVKYNRYAVKASWDSMLHDPGENS